MCIIPITFTCMAVNSLDSADIEYLSSSAGEVLCRWKWRQRWSFRQFKCSRTIMGNAWPGCFDDLFSIRNVSYRCHLLGLSARFHLWSKLVIAAVPHPQKVVDLGHSVPCFFLRLCLHFQLIFSCHCIQCSVITWRVPVIGSSKLSYDDCVVKGLA